MNHFDRMAAVRIISMGFHVRVNIGALKKILWRKIL